MIKNEQAAARPFCPMCACKNLQYQPGDGRPALIVEKLKTYIIDNIEEHNISVEVICRQFGVSRTQLYRKLSDHTDRPIAAYIRYIRLRMAKELLKKQNFTIAQVAYSTGFSSPSHFSRSFKKEYGAPPSERQ